MSKSFSTDRQLHVELPMSTPALTRLEHLADWLDGQADAQRQATAHTRDDQYTYWLHGRAQGMSTAAAALRNILEGDHK